ncbi:hypothetical protein ACFC09_18360 [Streptomyces sp. NPDC056161]|uniref:hypothetical protein n=1 Tax=Streptomyces sp. NPDC056161 TaxID=3345732 RepID=UPI0035D7F24A
MAGAFAAPAAQAVPQSPVGAQVHPYEWDTAEAGSPPSGMACVDLTGSTACFQKYGDKWWVKDTDPDGHSATASWKNTLWNGSAWILYRQGSCVNKLGAGKWGVCNKDYYEQSSKNYYGYPGSSLAWQACIYDSTAGTWHGCSNEASEVNNE